MAFVFKGAEQVLSSDVVSGLTISQDDPIDAAIVAYGGIIGGGSLSLMDFQSGSSLLDASASFHAPVARFGTSEQIDLAAFVSATTQKGQTSHLSFTEAAGNLSGTRTVTDGRPHRQHPDDRFVHRPRLRGQAMESAAPSSTFTSATSVTRSRGHGNAIASPVTS